jgi:hypothetical protein
MLYLGDVQSYFLAYTIFYSKSKMVLIGWIQAVSGDGRIIMPFTAGLAWRGGKENPHQPVAKPMGDSMTERVNTMFTQLHL